MGHWTTTQSCMLLIQITAMKTTLTATCTDGKMSPTMMEIKSGHQLK
jgi:hypothetical protein